MAAKTNSQQSVEQPAPKFEAIGYAVSDHMPLVVDGTQVNLASPTAELTAWLYERRDKIAGLKWL